MDGLQLVMNCKNFEILLKIKQITFSKHLLSFNKTRQEQKQLFEIIIIIIFIVSDIDI